MAQKATEDIFAGFGEILKIPVTARGFFGTFACGFFQALKGRFLYSRIASLVYYHKRNRILQKSCHLVCFSLVVNLFNVID